MTMRPRIFHVRRNLSRDRRFRNVSMIPPGFPIEHYLISDNVGLSVYHTGHLEEYRNQSRVYKRLHPI